MYYLSRILGTLLLSFCLAASPAFAFEAGLSDEAIREAYFLGQRRDEKMALFFETYRRYLPEPSSGPYVYMVEMFTPFAEAVNVSRKHGLGTGYSAQQASQEYRLRGDSLRVGVHVRYTATYGPGFGRTGAWKDFQVRLTQNGKLLQSRNLRYEGTSNSLGRWSRTTGFIVWLEYDASNVTSNDEAIVEVDTPDSQHLAATFDLSRLR